MAKYEDAVAFWRAAPWQSMAALAQKLENFRILFAYHSGKIENAAVTFHDTREIFENGKVLNYTGDPRALFEQQNQKLCYEFLLPKIAAGEPLTVELVKEVHRILTSGTYDARRYVENGERPGEFKKHDYITGRKEVGAAAEDVEEELLALLEELAGAGGAQPLKAGAYFHAVFENIHPFADGNGRTGRILLNYYLMTHDHPPLIVYSEDKALYYECLEQYDEKEELAPLIGFLKYETEKTWQASAALQSGEEKPRKGLADFLEIE